MGLTPKGKRKLEAMKRAPTVLARLLKEEAAKDPKASPDTIGRRAKERLKREEPDLELR